ncbi:F0F1 ATP synthase subunit delta [Brevibacterium sp. UBA7493]|uniref:F0F1 ATP synthase subunit delta n=1 Tax=Brevibacterium sp. UBA7493 TaxID=1946121 RepID=UPI00257DAEFA|nr:F0F1 ATP synthase subunit delta [Brevibacterium sp. UBA7493]
MLQSSRNSLNDVLDAVDSRLQGAAGAAATGLGDGLLSIVSAMADSAQLRRLMADGAIAEERKRGVLDTLFSGRVDAAALDIAKRAATLHWARPQDSVTALEDAGVTAIAAQAQAEGRLGEVEEELFRFTRLIESDHELGWAFESAAPAETKRALAANLLDGKAATETVKLAAQAAAHPRGARVSETLDRYSEVLARRQARSVAEVTVAKPMSDEQQERLAAALSAHYGRELVLNVHVDPDVVGGVRVQVGDEVMNSTISNRLSDLRRRLAS